MTEQSANKKSRHFSVVVRREFPMPVEDVFSAWIDPEIRRSVLSHGRYKNGVKECDIREEGLERYEDRWKNRLYGTTTRRYLVLRPSRMIIAQSETRIKGDMFDQHFATQELRLFKPMGTICEIVAADQCMSINPSFVHAAEDGLNQIFDIFASKL